jgi:hypothetical protein
MPRHASARASPSYWRPMPSREPGGSTGPEDSGAPPGPVDAAAVARISAIDDAALRNLWITAAYADFALRLQRFVDQRDHTWCGFAVWASATAGQSIRRQELPGVLLSILDRSHHRQRIDEANRRLRWVRLLVFAPPLAFDDVLAALDEAVDEVSARIGHGNKLVFDELAPLFVAFIEAAESRRLESDHDVDAALRSSGVAAADEVSEAFRWYGRALRSSDPVARARNMLAANVLAVAHEQQRLQHDIATALAAGPDSIDRLIEGPHRGRHRHRRWLRFGPLRRAVGHVALGAWDEVATELMMTLRVPHRTLRLDHDVPPDADGRTFPVDLADLADPLEPTEPSEVYARWDRTGGTGRHDGARDWSKLPLRMNFIVNLFRSRQQDTALSAPPFTSAQLEAMVAGRMPDPPLLPPGT